MGATDTGPKKKKFDDDDILRCFDEQHRRQVGKIELSAAEITEILNDKVLDEEKTVTRQAVDSRLNNGDLVGNKLVRNQHGRSYLYSRSDDLDSLFAPEPDDTRDSRPESEGSETRESIGSLGPAVAAVVVMTALYAVLSGGFVTSIQSFGTGGVLVLLAVVATFLLAEG